jgi:NADH dehydrogenase [ubiquinone] 1 alpha subcomplex assembly factor 5
MFGGQTLFELRCALQLAEVERKGGFGPHISPFITPQDIGSLLTRSGYSMLTIDTDEIKVNYPTIFELMNDLKGMAENNALTNRRKPLDRDTLLSAAAIYQTLYGNNDGTIAATFQVLYLIGWKPDESQQRPAERGSANFSLKDIANLEIIFKEENK